MNEKQDLQGSSATEPIKPWYRYPWPWVAIAIPAAAVIMGLATLYLALANPDYLVVDEEQYDEIKSELRAQPQSEAGKRDSLVPPSTGSAEPEASRDREDGEN